MIVKKYKMIALLLVLSLAGVLTFSLAWAAESNKASIAFMEGKVLFKDGRKGEWKAAAVGTELGKTHYLKTEKGAKAELKLPDGSVIRVAPDSQIRMKSLIFGKSKVQKERDFDMKLEAGRIWANVSKAVGGDQNFKIETGNAVAGVRGTVFQIGLIGAAKDIATVVKVYSGAVAVVGNAPQYQRKGDTKTNRVQVKGPQQVTKKKWEELVAKAMQQIRVASNGEMTMEGLVMEKEQKDDWVAWNLERDKAIAR